MKMKLRKSVLFLLSVIVLAPIVLYTDTLGSYFISSSLDEFVEEVSTLMAKMCPKFYFFQVYSRGFAQDSGRKNMCNFNQFGTEIFIVKGVRPDTSNFSLELKTQKANEIPIDKVRVIWCLDMKCCDKKHIVKGNVMELYVAVSMVDLSSGSW